jgi:hypothetical protein
VSTLQDAATVLTGVEPVSGDRVGLFGRGMALAGVVTPATGVELRGAAKILGGIAERLGRPIADVVARGVRRVEFALQDGSKMVFRGPETHPLTRGGAPVTHYNVEVHAPTGQPGRFTKVENTHLDSDGRVINP